MTRNPRCREIWEGGHIDPFDDEQVDAADLEDRRLRAELKKQGVSEMAGPPPRKPGNPALAVQAAWGAQA